MKPNFTSKLLLIVFTILFVYQVNEMVLTAQNSGEKSIPKLENPFTQQYLKKSLRKSHPRLVLNATIERDLKKKN